MDTLGRLRDPPRLVETDGLGPHRHRVSPRILPSRRHHPRVDGRYLLADVLERVWGVVPGYGYAGELFGLGSRILHRGDFYHDVPHAAVVQRGGEGVSSYSGSVGGPAGDVDTEGRGDDQRGGAEGYSGGEEGDDTEGDRGELFDGGEETGRLSEYSSGLMCCVAISSARMMRVRPCGYVRERKVCL